jgi:hypothetical protein
VSVETCLEFDMNRVRCMIDKQASSSVPLILIGLACRCEQSALGGAHEMIGIDTLTGKEVSGLLDTSAVLDSRLFLATAT